MSLLTVDQVCLRSPSHSLSLFAKYSLFNREFILLALFLTCLYAFIKISDFALTAALLILSLVRNRAFKSEDIQGLYLSDTRLSIEGACFSITKDNVLINLSTITFISFEHTKIADQLTAARSAKKASCLLCLFFFSFSICFEWACQNF